MRRRRLLTCAASLITFILLDALFLYELVFKEVKYANHDIPLKTSAKISNDDFLKATTATSKHLLKTTVTIGVDSKFKQVQYANFTKLLMATNVKVTKENFLLQSSTTKSKHLLYATKGVQLTYKINRSVQKIFENIATRHVWGGGNETISGRGSLFSSTASVRKCLGSWIKQYNITSMVDIPCGDANWQRFIPGISDVKYMGFDISPHVVNRARQRNPKSMEFGILDITSDVPPPTDLVLMRDLIQHLPLKLGVQAIKNARLSGAKWLAITSYKNRLFNFNIVSGGYFYNNVMKPPFNLRKVYRACENYSGKERKVHPGSVLLLVDIQNDGKFLG